MESQEESGDEPAISLAAQHLSEGLLGLIKVQFFARQRPFSSILLGLGLGACCREGWGHKAPSKGRGQDGSQFKSGHTWVKVTWRLRGRFKELNLHARLPIIPDLDRDLDKVSVAPLPSACVSCQKKRGRRG